MTHSDCYEKGHTPDRSTWDVCTKCGEQILAVKVNGDPCWHTQAELDRLWQGVDREAARVLGEERGE